MSNAYPEYQERLDYLYGRLNYELQGLPRTSAELRLGRMRRILRRLGDPQDAFAIIHVAGTKGKGSTSVLIAAALTASGRRTGLFTSPHLIHLEERFRVDDREINPADLIRLTDQIRPIIEELDRTDPQFAERGATFFEITTALGLLHFAEVKAKTVVLEVGLGGRLDSTNAIHPKVSVITSISFDHTRLLGNTLAQIAGEKAGILKRGRPAVVGAVPAEAREAIRGIAAIRRCSLHEFDHDFTCTFTPPAPPLTRPCAGEFHARTWRSDWGPLPVPLFGAHQARNATVALATLDVLAENGIEVSRSDAERGFARVSWPARLEVMSERPLLVIDGAHNVASAEALAEAMRMHFPPGPRTLIFGTTKEKDLLGQLIALLPEFDHVIATRYIENPRAVPLDEIREAIVKLNGREPMMAPTPADALAAAHEITPQNGLICVAGSLFLAGEIRGLARALHTTPTRSLVTP